MPNVTIVMYHYVRPIAGSRWPRLKGLEFDHFKGQLDYLQQHYMPISVSDLMAAHAGEPMPDNALLLTFDDGYADHYHYAFAELRARGLTGAFFPPARAVLEGRLLDVNKIHFILAATEHHAPLVDYMEQQVAAATAELGLDSLQIYRQTYAQPNRFDTAEVIYLKRMLQRALPFDLRTRITDALFAKHVSSDEQSFAYELYCTQDQLAEMAAAGMSIGGHGYAHSWLNSLDREQQAQEITRSRDMLQTIGALQQYFLFCYPYGAYNSDTLDLLKDAGCHAAFTTQVAQVSITRETDMLQLPRLDTNDFPRARTVERV